MTGPSPYPRKVRVGVMISGAGSNMSALIAASRHPEATFEVVLVLANKTSAAGLAKAEAEGVTAQAIAHKNFPGDREAHERALHAALLAHEVEVLALAGYMRVLTPWLVSQWDGRMLNIHPSLLPLYPGLDTHARAIEAGDAEAGCTVHLVTEGVDEGPILGQARVPILSDDTSDTLAARVLQAEHQLYPQVLDDFCRGFLAVQA